MRVKLRMPDAESREQLARALSADASIHLVDDEGGDHDVLIVHAELFRTNGRSLRSLLGDSRAVIVFAQDDPKVLAGYMAAGARGYHSPGESWEALIDALHTVARGGARSDPVVMDQLLQRYRRLLREGARR